MSDSDETLLLIQRVDDGDRDALGDLLSKHRDRLRRIVNFRIDRRLRSRIDADDVMQEAFVEATTRFPKYLEDRRMSFFVWLRFLTLQKLLELHRHHLGVQARDAGREVSIDNRPIGQASSAVLAAQLLGKRTSPTQFAVRAELQSNVEDAMNQMDPVDREVLALRHFEHLSNQEVSQILDLTESAASNRYIRAAKRLKKAMETKNPGAPADQSGSLR